MKHQNPKLAALADTAIEAIRTLVSDPNTPPAVRLRAAKLILDAVSQGPANGPDGGGDDDNNHALPRPSAGPQPTAAASERTFQPAAIATQNAAYRPAPKIGRNDYCPCRSGLKYKKCCLEKFERSRQPNLTLAARTTPLAREAPLAIAA